MSELERDRDRDRERQRDRETERQRDRETERQRERERQRDRQLKVVFSLVLVSITVLLHSDWSIAVVNCLSRSLLYFLYFIFPQNQER